MFTELMPLLAERTVLITMARESDTTIRANVCPKRTAEGEDAALSTPLSFVETPEELDEDFARELTAYVDTHRQLGSTLAQAKATMEASANAAQEKAKRKEDERRKAKPSSSKPAPWACLSVEYKEQITKVVAELRPRRGLDGRRDGATIETRYRQFALPFAAAK